MGLGAILAGVITAFTALFKYSLAAMIHAPLLLALAHSLNYVVSFLLMQAGGFLLASKMPAVTAATLVDAMEDPEKDHMVSLQAISQTQFIVTISNLLGAVPASIAMDRIINAVRGHPFLTESAGYLRWPRGGRRITSRSTGWPRPSQTACGFVPGLGPNGRHSWQIG
jgi:site-specific recombinase